MRPRDRWWLDRLVVRRCDLRAEAYQPEQKAWVTRRRALPLRVSVYPAWQPWGLQPRVLQPRVLAKRILGYEQLRTLVTATVMGYPAQMG